MTLLRQQMIDQMTVRGMAETTKRAYLQAVVGIAKYYRRSPEQLNEREVQQYLLHLIQERGLAWSSCKRGDEWIEVSVSRHAGSARG